MILLAHDLLHGGAVSVKAAVESAVIVEGVTVEAYLALQLADAGLVAVMVEDGVVVEEEDVNQGPDDSQGRQGEVAATPLRGGVAGSGAVHVAKLRKVRDAIQYTT